MKLLRFLKQCIAQIFGRREEPPAPPPAPPPVKKIPALVLEFLQLKHGSGVGLPHERSLRSKLGHFARHFDIPALELKGAAIAQWLSTEVGGGPRNRKNYRAAVILFTNWLVDNDHLPVGWREMKRVPVPKCKPGEIVVLEPADMFQLLLELPPAVQTALALVGFAGLRTQEVIASKEIAASKRLLDWADIQFGNRKIYVSGLVAKTGKPRSIPIHPNLLAWLERIPPEQRIGPICPQRGALNLLSDAKRAVGIPAGRNETHNAARNSFITFRIVVTQDHAQVAYEAGTSLRNLRTSYDRGGDEAQARAWFEIFPPVRIDPVEHSPDTLPITQTGDPWSCPKPQ